MLRTLSTLLLWLILAPCPEASAQQDSWKAGVSRTVITPEESMWMAGFGSRTKPSEGTLHDICAKALALEDARGNKSVMITTDLLGIPKDVSDKIKSEIYRKHGLSKAQILINSSHTHSAPVLENTLVDAYPLDPSQPEKISKYTVWLTGKIIDLAGAALTSMQPADLSAANGVARFQVNRRNNPSTGLETRTELKGPNDFAVPVLKVEDKKGNLLAIAFGYACHPTSLAFNLWSGDYAGFAQIELEKAYPGTTALFFQGAGADQNPLPRMTLGLSVKYGRELSAAVRAVLDEKMNGLSPRLTTVYREIDLPLAPHPSREELVKEQANNVSYVRRWATRMLEKREKGEKLITSYPYPLQIWKIGEQPLFALGGELVSEYAIGLKKIFGKDIFVAGYSNDVMAYIPSEIILKEGGYEGDRAKSVYGMPSAWATGTEDRILKGMTELAAEAGIPRK